jgi:hypothetical protein
LEKSIERFDRRAGVPVFNRPSWNPALLSDLLRFKEGGSPARPAGYDCNPSIVMDDKIRGYTNVYFTT